MKTVCTLVLTATLAALASAAYAQKSTEAQAVEQPVTVNGDVVEYFTERNEVLAQGAVRVNYKGTKLSCEKLTVNTLTKDAVAEGKVRIDDEYGVIEGERVTYNFNTKKGVLDSARFWSSPYFGTAETIQMQDKDRFAGTGAAISTCSMDRPHYKLRSKKFDIAIHDRIQTSDTTVFIGNAPIAYAPVYSHSLRDPLMHVQLSPGYSKDWGAYLLSAWRFSLAENFTGRIYLDYRDRLGLGSGVGANVRDTGIGSADFKFYYTNENPTRQDNGAPGEYERYLLRLRHQYKISERDSLISEYYRIEDKKRDELGDEYNVLKDYFPREYDNDSQPLSYSAYTHAFDRASFSALIEKNPTDWYTRVEKLPEIKYNLPSIRIGETPFYFQNISQAAALNKELADDQTTGTEQNVNRIDTTNSFSLPFKASVLQFNPFVSGRVTYYDKDASGASIDPRTVFSTGTEVSTRFFRTFDVSTNALNLDINQLRHVFNPSLTYLYVNKPSIASNTLPQMDAIDEVSNSNGLILALTNKLQTKRKGASVDLVNFRMSTDYMFKYVDPDDQTATHNYFGASVLKLELLPYSWMSFISDATYDHQEDYFSKINYDFGFTFAPERTLGFGQHLQKGGANEISAGLDWRLTPKWKFHAYERYQVSERSNLDRGLLKQEYGFSRDLHCWIMDFVYTKEKEEGHTVWCIFRLKAFPETLFDLRQNFRSPRTGNE